MATFSTVMISLLLLSLSVSSPPRVTGNSLPNADCSAVILNLASCLPFLMIGSQVDKPEDACCTGLKTVLDTNAACLCEGLKNGGSMGLKINVTKASTLPVACSLNAPPASACGLSTTTPPTAPSTPAPRGSRPGSTSAPAPSPSKGNHGSSISSLSFVISGALVILFSRV